MSDNHFPPPIPPFPTLKEKKHFTYPLIQHRRSNWNNALNEGIIDKVLKHLEKLFAFYQLGFSYQSYGGSEMLRSVFFYVKHNSGNDAI